MTRRPLITAEEVFPALERLVAGAEGEVLLSFRLFDPRTRLRDPDIRDRGLQTWADLVAHVTRKGVRLRFLLADFDPVFAKDLHRSAWRNASGFADVVRGDAQILLAPHGQRAGLFWRLFMTPRLRREKRALRNEAPTRLTPVQRRILQQGAELRPVTLHQKFAVADGERCMIGGLDIDERRFDTVEHDRPPQQTWHDVSVSIGDRDFCGALRSHFADCWNAALACGAAPLADRAEPMDATSRPQSRDDIRLVRTFSAPCPGAARLAPVTRAAEHETTLLRLFAEAQRYVYLESQFIRHGPLVDALCAAASRQPDLQLILVLPAAPERVLFDGDNSWNARHAQWLQVNAIDRLDRAFGHRFAAVSPALGQPANGRVADLADAAPIYVHAKVTVVDDRVALVGSANLNGRSLRWDTEASVLLRDPELATKLQRRLARKWLGPEGEDRPAAQAATWARIAAADKARPGADRSGLVLPYPIEKSRRFARWFFVLPDEMF